uniref:Anillin n=1 Tax=Oncorhynchus kisutch TaxID=8019 RepID=A0A8C7FLJ9_ONCKI
MAERPTAANRQMAKRAREPLAETCNSLVTVPVIEKAPHPSSKPSPSKRSRSGELGQPSMIDEENREPSMTSRTLTPTLTDPQTDRKPPTGPASVRSAASLERVAVRPPAPVPEPEPIAAPQPQRTKNVEVVPASLVLQGNREAQREAPTSSTPAAMKSRLARLAEQRQYWDSEGTSEVRDIPAALSPVKNQIHPRQALAPVPTPVPAAASSEAPMGRKGRLANLAASIGSWEDDLSHAAPQSRDHAQGNPGSVNRTQMTVCSKQQVILSSLVNKFLAFLQHPFNSPVKSTGVVPPSHQKTEVPEARPARQTSRGLPSPLPSPQRSCQGRASAFTPSSQKGAPSPVPQSPLKNQALSRALDVNASPKKSELPTQPSNTEPSVLQTRERFTKEATPATPLQQRGTAGATGVKSFMERFGERCQERSVNSSGAGLVGHTPVVSHSGTPNTRLVQERLRAAQVANTTTADLAQKQKLERESELAQIRNRFQKGNNIWKIKDEEADTKRNTEAKVGDEDVSHELEVNVDQSINSDVINGIFDGLHDQSEVQSGEEEDELNISSMSILTPFSETVAAVVKSPVKMMMSTPASSFNAKSLTPDSVSRPSKFQRARMLRAGSSDRLETDDGHNLPYSIDAYRSTRIKESTERPRVRQVIVRKEDVSRRAAEEPRSQGHTNIKQKMKVLTNEINLQQTVISQASQALNCCTDEEHGKGSQVEAEAERLLLIATEKRGALKAELDRLKGEGPSGQMGQGGDMGVTASKGSISLLELRLPLKADFVCSTGNNPEWSSHYFFIMIRAGAENTVATPLASTRSAISGDAITFSTKFTMPDVSNEFAIDIEVYCLEQKRELNPDKRKKPSKSKVVIFSQMLVASPGGPNAVRTSNFVLVGSHKLTLASIGKNKFSLEKIKYEGIERALLKDMFHSKVPFLCPLEGHLYLKMQCEVGSLVEERGFLTMFEDVSGFGAWHRRWCLLSGYSISYWTYPDDEKRKKPIGRINLANCTSCKVEPANREFCARPNTFELITVRPQRESDIETLVSQCKNTMCVTKNWLCADTKDERNVWMQKLNQILVDLRMWQPDSCYRPV